MLSMKDHLRDVTQVTLDEHGQLSMNASSLITPALEGRDTRLDLAFGDTKLGGVSAGAAASILDLLHGVTGRSFLLVRKKGGVRFWEREDLVRLGAAMRAR